MFGDSEPFLRIFGFRFIFPFYFLPFYFLPLVFHATENLIVKPALWQEYGNTKGNPDNLWNYADSEPF
jgi:hypothetical protein